MTEAAELTVQTSSAFVVVLFACHLRLLAFFFFFELEAAGRLTVPTVDLIVKNQKQKKEKISERPCGYWKLLRASETAAPAP